MKLNNHLQAGTDLSAGPHAGLAPVRQLLAMFGLAPHIAEPTAMIADILGWRVIELPPGPAMQPRADLCLAMLPADSLTPLPPMVAWSPNKNLNEHISACGLSILEQPPCIQHLERLLQITQGIPSRRGRSE